MGKHLFILALISITVFGCKVQKISNQNTSSVDSQEDNTGNTPTTVPDTIQSTVAIAEPVPDSVDIAIHRIFKDTISIIGVGDIMMGTNYPKESYLPPSEGADLMSDVYDILNDADITFGNLEGVILDDGGTPKNCRNPDACYVFRTPESYGQYLVKAGFNLMSIANNHAGDFGDEGRANTQRVLDSLGIAYSGQLDCPIATIIADDMIYSLVSFAPNVGTISIHDYDQARRLIQKADSISDIVIVSFHGGAEGSKYEIVPQEREFFYGEDRGDVHEFARIVIDAGADVVFGHGPHVTRSLDIYNDRIIIYSLGNFCTYGRFNLRGVNGIAPILKVHTNSAGEFLSGEITPIYQPGAGGVKIDPNDRVIAKMRELLEKNFPENGLTVDEAGIINYLKTDI